MRPTQLSLSSQTYTAPVPLDYKVPVSISVDFPTAGTLTYSVQYTNDNIYAKDYNPATGTWVNFPEATSLTAATTFLTSFFCRAVRLNVSSYSSGTVRMTVSESFLYQETYTVDRLVDSLSSNSELQTAVYEAAVDGGFSDAQIAAAAERGKNNVLLTPSGDSTGVIDSAAMVAALAALPANGGTIELSAGVFYFSEMIDVTSNGVTIRGQSKEGTQLLKMFEGDALIKFNTSQRFSLSDALLQGNNDTTGSGDLVLVAGSSFGAIRNCYIANAKRYGINIEQAVSGSYYNIIDGCHIFNSGAANIRCGDESSETKVIGGEITSSVVGWLIEGGNGHSGLGCSLEGNSEAAVKVGTVSTACQVALFGARMEGASVSQYGVRIKNANTNVALFGCHITSNTVADIDDPDSSILQYFGCTPGSSSGSQQALSARVAILRSPLWKGHSTESGIRLGQNNGYGALEGIDSSGSASWEIFDSDHVYLKTRSGSGLRFETDYMGFYKTAPVAKQTVTGSRGGNAALANLLTALANLGLITDSSS